MKTLFLDLKENVGVLVKGFIGMASSGAGAWISLSDFDIIMRIICSIVGAAVGIVTIWSIWCHRNDKNK